ncbi:MAG: 2'-5' RNA ligase family protein [Ginsengibacter sp.]
MINNTRRQLTLFVEEKDAENIERVRKEFNLKQSELIKSHVTLCREDEIENLEQVIANLSDLTEIDISIDFGRITRFSNGKGVLLPAQGDNIEFHELRKKILHGLTVNPRMHEPHITLMHPRNSTCTDDIFRQIKEISLPEKLKFKVISLIEQREGGAWNVLQKFYRADEI